MSGCLGPRRRPCSSCPYRRDAPSGLWARNEYERLLRYDGTTGEQAEQGAFGPFLCHHDDGHLCAGWVGCHDMYESLAIRLAQVNGLVLDLDAIFAYRSPVPLFASGREAAEHGLRDLDAPNPETQRRMRALLRSWGRRRD